MADVVTEILARTKYLGKINVIEMNGCIILEGYTRTYYYKQIAQQQAMRLSKLQVINRIEVR